MMLTAFKHFAQGTCRERQEETLEYTFQCSYAVSKRREAVVDNGVLQKKKKKIMHSLLNKGLVSEGRKCNFDSKLHDLQESSQ